MITYRRAVYSDLEVLVDMRMEFLADVNRVSIREEEKTIVRQNFKEYLEELLPKDEFVAWLALDGQEVIATSGLSFYRRPPSYMVKNGQSAYIMNMYTKEAYRNQGIAKELFERVLNEAKDRGCDYINLHATKMGQPVYEKFGFVFTEDEMKWVETN